MGIDQKSGIEAIVIDFINTSIKRENDNDDKTKKKELILDLAKRLHDDELQRTKDLDNKAGNLIQYISLATGLNNFL